MRYSIAFTLIVLFILAGCALHKGTVISATEADVRIPTGMPGNEIRATGNVHISREVHLYCGEDKNPPTLGDMTVTTGSQDGEKGSQVTITRHDTPAE
jgi:hypothetical protein